MLLNVFMFGICFFMSGILNIEHGYGYVLGIAVDAKWRCRRDACRRMRGATHSPQFRWVLQLDGYEYQL